MIHLCCCCINKIRRKYIITPSIQSKSNQIQFGKFKFYSSNVSHLFLQSILKLYDKKLSHKYHNKRIITRDNGNVQSYDQEESKLISTIKANSGPHILAHD